MTNIEKKNISVARKSICSKRYKQRKKFTLNNLICLRPGTGISPMLIDKIWKKIKKNFQKSND